MPRDIPVGNGKLLLTFDNRYQLRDLYFPHVGQENHAGAGPCRFGIHTDVPGKSRSQLAWTSDSSWKIHQRYLRDTLTTSVSLQNDDLRVSIYCNDTVDFHRRVFVRRMLVRNHADTERTIRIIHHQDFNMFGSKVGDTAYFDPDLQSLVHYRGNRYLMVTFFSGDGKQALHEYATGTSGFHGQEGTWRDAEDGHLQGNAIAQGAVDSTVAHHVVVPAHGERVAYLVMIAGESRQELLELHKWIGRMTPQGVIDRTSAYWRLWVGGTNIHFGNLPRKVVELFKRSLLVVRTQVDNNGAIIAANDSDIMQFSRDTYSYVWPRDGALVADSLDLAGFPDLARWFYTFCQKTITEEGYFLHKYNPDGSPASSWHPWVINGKRAMPIQEDETALVVWALWRHYFRYRDIEFIRPLWVDIVQKAADFMCRYRDTRTGLPLPSYDLWEERWGVHAFTVATVYGGLKAARNFAVCFGDRAKAEQYARAADEVRAGAAKYLYSERLGRFVRRLVPLDQGPSTQAGECEEISGACATSEVKRIYDEDEVIDASLYSIFKFHLFPGDDPRVASTMRAVEEKLWVKTKVGGVARYENDYYQKIATDTAQVPGNPWFICTLWLADYFITRAQTAGELKQALPIFEWCADRALESGVLAEQVDPYTNAPISVSPLTWSHATVVSTVIKYLEKLEQMQTCQTCSQPMFRLRRAGAVEMRSHAVFDRDSAGFMPDSARETSSFAGAVTRNDGEGERVCGTIAIDPNDCIGCDVCVTNCSKGVLKMVDSKAMIDLRNLDQCDLDGRCVDVCPTDVISIQPADPSTAVEPGLVPEETVDRLG
jgi:oligosaccharide amylase